MAVVLAKLKAEMSRSKILPSSKGDSRQGADLGLVWRRRGDLHGKGRQARAAARAGTGVLRGWREAWLTVRRPW